MDLISAQALADFMMTIFNAIALFLQNALGALGLNLPITIIAILLIILILYSISRSSVLSLLAIGTVFLFLVTL